MLSIMKRIILVGLVLLTLTGCLSRAPIGFGSQNVVYSVTGDGTAVINYTTVSSGSVGQQSANGEALPWSERFSIEPGLSYVALSVVAIGDGATTKISCTITVNGKVVAEQSSTGPRAMVGCTVTNR